MGPRRAGSNGELHRLTRCERLALDVHRKGSSSFVQEEFESALEAFERAASLKVRLRHFSLAPRSPLFCLFLLVRSSGCDRLHRCFES